jgi:DNA primase
MSLGDLKDKIKAAPISAVVGHYLRIEKKGSAQLALCPFHGDSKPSLNVNDHKGLFMCFACGTGGDALTFIQKFKRIEFVDALKEAAKILNIPYDDDYKNSSASPKVKMAQRILGKASQIYRKVAANESGPIFKDFVNDRKLSEKTLENFSVGLAPNHNVISEYLQSISDQKDRSFALNIALEIGVIRKDTKTETSNNYYDTFRDRIIFPIWDQYGNTTGIGGRKTKEFQKAKYMNSQESFCFNKKNILYGYHLAKNFIRQNDYVILVEGYMDLISLHQNDFPASVAVMGIALSDFSVSNLLNHTKNIYFGLDSDIAGLKAMERMNQSFMAKGVLPKYLDFSPHKDPDEFLNEMGQLALKKLFDEAPAFLDKTIEDSLPETLPQLPDRKLELLEQVFELIAPLGENLLATERAISLANRIGLNSGASQIIEAYKKFLAKRPALYKSPRAPQEEAKPSQVTDNSIPMEEMPEDMNAYQMENPYEGAEGNEQTTHGSADLSKIEKILLQELIQFPECLLREDIGELLDFAHNNEVKTYVNGLITIAFEIDDSSYANAVSSSLVDGGYSLELKEIVATSLFRYQKIDKDQETVNQMMSDLLNRLKEEELKEKRTVLRDQQKKCSTEQELHLLLNKLHQVEIEMKQIKYSKSINSNTQGN